MCPILQNIGSTRSNMYIIQGQMPGGGGTSYIGVYVPGPSVRVSLLQYFGMERGVKYKDFGMVRGINFPVL